MPRGRPKGYAKSGGRSKGTPNKVPGDPNRGRIVKKAIDTEFLIRSLDAAGIPQTKLEDMHPLSVIHFVMVERFRSGDFSGALLAAGMLAPYTNARLSSSEVKVTHEWSTLSEEELQAKALEYERKIAAANGTATIEGEVVH